jgi:flagellar basal-body rod protein FlgG
MFRSLSTAATGMDAQQIRLDVIANNLANVNTAGFKRDQIHFEDLLYQIERMPGGRNAQGNAQPTGLEVGHGTRLADISKSFSQGSLVQTQNPFDLAIEGRGFFRIQLPSGQYVYTRDGTFRNDSEGRVVTSAGDVLDPGLEIPPETTQVTITRDGVVTAFRADAAEGTEIGRVSLVDFPNPAGLESAGRNYLKQTAASGEPIEATPGTSGVGSISQGYLEQSNVKVVEEMIDMITTQRAYELNSKVIQTADTMLQNATRIR